MAWSSQQSQAIQAVNKWLADPKRKQVFRLFGYAGTGKTTLAREIANNTHGLVLFGSFTGKAALVLQSKGCSNASTIHSMIYKVVEDEFNQRPKFVLNHDSMLYFASLVIIDEVSMVNEEIGRDLLSFGVPILVLGDPFQLPPVRGAGFFTSGEVQPDVVLTEIHRQAADNPIIRMSTDIREGKQLNIGEYGKSKVVDRKNFDMGGLVDYDQVLAGLNKTRRTMNSRVRHMNGVESTFPIVGDKLICLRNNREKGLLNGSLWNATSVVSQHHVVEIKVKSIDGFTDSIIDTRIPNEFFEGTEDSLEWNRRRMYDEFDYGYCITVHKAQGSQWDEVVLLNESPSFREYQRQWLYTGITRAAERITVVV